MNNICSAPACPIILDSTCVFYSGANLVYTGVNTNDNLQLVLEKIDNKFRDAGLGYVFTNGVVQTAPGQPVKLGGLLVENTTINSQGFTFGLSGTIRSSAFITTGGTSSQFVKGDGSLDSGSYQPTGNYITALTGDGTASGPGSSVFTLATVFNAPATYGSATRVPIITVNAKGLVTNVTTTVISVPSSSVSINGDVYGYGNTGVPFNLTLQNVLATPGVYGSVTAIPVINVNSKGLITSISQVAISGGGGTGTVTSVAVTPGTGISASVANPTTTPNITITNTAPDQVVSLSPTGTGLSITGTYPSFTLQNTLPDQTVTLTNGTGISVTGTYPSFTITNTGSSITPAALTKVDDTNVTLTLGGSPSTALLAATSLTLGWTGTLADSRIASATTWNGKQDAITLTAIGTSGVATFIANTLNIPDYGAGYTIPTLQEVTDAGSTTTNSITVSLLNISGVANPITLDGYSDGSFVITRTGTLDELLNLNNGVNSYLKFGGSNSGSGAGQFVQINTSNDADVYLQAPSTSGTIPVSVNGNFADAAGNITISTGSGTVTSVDLTMPSAFTVTGNPVTTSGTLAVTGAGLVSQYVRGDGTLANFPISTGGGSSVSYYLNGSVNQGTFGGVTYYEINGTPVIGAGTDFTINADGYIAQFITDAGDPNKLLIPAGNWNFETYFSASSSGGSPSFYIELYKYDGATFTLIASNSATPENITGGTSIDLYFTALAIPSTVLLVTDRLAVRFYVTHSGRTIKMHTEDSHLSQIITTFSTGLTALNGLTAQVQNFANDTNVTMVSSGSTHTITWAGTLADSRIASATTWNAKIGGSGTTNEIAYFTAGSTIASLPVATYPSLTELSYVKGVTSAIQTQINSKGYTLALTSISSALVTATTYYFGMGGRALTTTADQSRVYIPKTGIIKKAYITSFSGTTGTITSITVSIRLNNTTDTLVFSSTASALFRTYINNSLSISVTEGDYIEMKVTSVSSVAPITNIFSGTLYIE